MRALDDAVARFCKTLGPDGLDHTDHFYAEVTTAGGNRTTWGGNLGAEFHDGLKNMLSQAWDMGYEARNTEKMWDADYEATNPYKEET